MSVAIGIGIFFFAGIGLSAFSGWTFLFWGVVAPVVGLQLAYFGGAAFAVMVLGAGEAEETAEAELPATVKRRDSATA
jgi:hypothetical protein